MVFDTFLLWCRGRDRGEEVLDVGEGRPSIRKYSVMNVRGNCTVGVDVFQQGYFVSILRKR